MGDQRALTLVRTPGDSAAPIVYIDTNGDGSFQPGLEASTSCFESSRGNVRCELGAHKVALAARRIFDGVVQATTMATTGEWKQTYALTAESFDATNHPAKEATLCWIEGNACIALTRDSVDARLLLQLCGLTDTAHRQHARFSFAGETAEVELPISDDLPLAITATKTGGSTRLAVTGAGSQGGQATAAIHLGDELLWDAADHPDAITMNAGAVEVDVPDGILREGATFTMHSLSLGPALREGPVVTRGLSEVIVSLRWNET